MDYKTPEGIDMNQALEDFCGKRFDLDKSDEHQDASNWDEFAAKLAAATSKLEQLVSIERVQ